MSNTELIPDREPIAQGRFYPASSVELISELESISDSARKLTHFRIPDNEKLRAIVVPHAGYVFSGVVAASAFNLLSQCKKPKCIFLLGSSHTTLFEGASVYAGGNYKTPLGSLPVDKEKAAELLKHAPVFQFKRDAHTREHSLEVQLAFIQHFISSTIPIVPIILGNHSAESITNLAQILKPYFTDQDNFFIISTDLSHYPSYNDAKRIDKQTVEAVCKNNPDELVKQLKLNANENIPGLATSMCGWTSVKTMLTITQNDKKITYHPLLYQNSGDAQYYGDKLRVVGYQSIAITQKK